jgi:hypothetical protein
LTIPGATLNPGDYTIEVVNQLSDRIVLRVRDKSGAALSTFLGVERQSPSRARGPVAWSNAVDGQKYLRGWNFQGAPSAVEFVYPKDDAVKIATANPSKVPAVDPGSEGKPTDNTLSQSDLELLNLWLLHLDQVSGGGQGSIKASGMRWLRLRGRSPLSPGFRTQRVSCLWSGSRDSVHCWRQRS